MIYCFVRKITNSEYYGRYGSGVIGSERMYCNVRSVGTIVHYAPAMPHATWHFLL